MDRVRIVSPPTPKDAVEIKLIQNELGVEKSYRIRKGNKISYIRAFDTFRLEQIR